MSDQLMKEQVKTLASYWNPPQEGLDQQLAIEFMHLWRECIDRINILSFSYIVI